MTTKAVKISNENYRWLCEVAGTIQASEGRTVSIDEAVSSMRKKVAGKLSDLAGTWKLSDEEAGKLFKDLRRGWDKWTKSA
jgi:hypothetical protein